MMNELQQLLRNIGLSEKEAITYLINLKIGTNPASIIAKKSELNRGTTYTILESLVKKGLIHQIEKNKISYFTAAEPKQLIHFIDLKRCDLAFYKKEIIHLLDEFSKLRHPYQIKPKLKSYSGKVGQISIYNEILMENALSIWSISSNKPNYFITHFAPLYLNKFNSFKLINNSKNSSKKYHIKSVNDLNNIQNLTPVEFIGENKIFICPPNEKYNLEIISKDITHIFQEKFNSFWKNN